ncbi:U-box domain-containing protein 17-like [Macadamia integrifolia]|uniref:U-box domain-containing protein 17-like n=1 Tax=Macadamia integrifolia TaxID=60698 RepID=UPI001C4EC320|nr:U-box domain-containing protein 17-like [Macadamia integrifolia]
MASAAIFSSLRRRRSPSLEGFLASVHLNDVALLQTLVAVGNELILSNSNRSLPFQRRNSRSLIWMIQNFVVLFEILRETGSKLPSTAVLCFKELYLLMYRSKILIGYCSQSSRLWLLLQNCSISGHFHDLNQEISTLLDIFPLKELELPLDIREQIELMQRQSRKAKLFIEQRDEMLRLRLFFFLDQFERGQIPDQLELRRLFVDRLGIRDAKTCRAEIESLEEQMYNHGGDIEPTVSVLNGFVALTRYCRFLLFGFEEEEMGSRNHKKPRKGLISLDNGEANVSIPKDFVCPISLDLMRDPVIISTGQTYERSSIAQWMVEGHRTCPKTGQMLDHTRLVPNRALRSLISQWCSTHGIRFDPPDGTNTPMETIALAAASKATTKANTVTAELLIRQLSNGSDGAKTVAVRELRLLAKTGKENRACIAEAGAIPLLQLLLPSQNPVAQENAVTALLNLSIHDKNKSRIIEEAGCLGSIVEVLRFGHTTEARENAAATLFSLSAVHDYKKRITDEEGAVETLAGLLREGSLRGKKDAVTALFNLSTHMDNCKKMIESGAMTALVEALGTEGTAEEAAGALALLVRQPIGAEAVGKEEMAVAGLIGMMRRGTPRGKENAVVALLELCRSGGAAATERVVRAPALGSLLQALLFTGTKRARRKAASLARVCQRCQTAAALPIGGWGAGYGFSSSSMMDRGSSFTRDVSVPVS